MHNQSNDLPPISFTGKFESGKDIDCVLVFEEDTESFVLERVSATVKRLTHDRLGGQMASQRLAAVSDSVPNRTNSVQVVNDPVQKYHLQVSSADAGSEKLISGSAANVTLEEPSSDLDQILDMSGRPIVAEDFDELDGSDDSFDEL
uniref:Transcription elongation factor Eaf N-terminal domain-containing protein n=1 Tax=Spongospora subterranea TaxID=70186 RepID=A0A0H5R1D4_9EUKA|eukprot:CRZ01614.1 hypothetical protein [Spongospora subterranea]